MGHVTSSKRAAAESRRCASSTATGKRGLGNRVRAARAESLKQALGLFTKLSNELVSGAQAIAESKATKHPHKTAPAKSRERGVSRQSHTIHVLPAR
jgi:hypothetical protein